LKVDEEEEKTVRLDQRKRGPACQRSSARALARGCEFEIFKVNIHFRPSLLFTKIRSGSPYFYLYFYHKYSGRVSGVRGRMQGVGCIINTLPDLIRERTDLHAGGLLREDLLEVVNSRM
jgi:hypothetical protein